MEWAREEVQKTKSAPSTEIGSGSWVVCKTAVMYRPTVWSQKSQSELAIGQRLAGGSNLLGVFPHLVPPAALSIPDSASSIITWHSPCF